MGIEVGTLSVEVPALEDVPADDVFLCEDVAEGSLVEEAPLDDVVLCEDVSEGLSVEEGWEDVVDGPVVGDEGVVRLVVSVVVDPGSVFCVEVLMVEEEEESVCEDVRLCDGVLEDTVLVSGVDVPVTEDEGGDDKDVGLCDDVLEDPLMVSGVDVTVEEDEEGDDEDVGLCGNVMVLVIEYDEEDLSLDEDVEFPVAVVCVDGVAVVDDQNDDDVKLAEDDVSVKLVSPWLG